MHPTITLYTKDYCPFCKATIALLGAKGVRFENHEVSNDPLLLAEMMARSHGARTVPQIFIGDFHVGGHSDLVALDADGHLDPLLGLVEPA